MEEGNDLARKDWNETGTDVFEYKGVWLQSPAWKVITSRFVLEFVYIYIHTYLLNFPKHLHLRRATLTGREVPTIYVS